jgi:hypothetical protein
MESVRIISLPLKNWVIGKSQMEGLFLIGVVGDANE